jgi:ParB family chromosome partitioning protein
MQTFETIQASTIISRNNDRQQFDNEKLTDLAWSIKTNGLAQPITVRPVEGHFEIVAGERRFRAMTAILGLSLIQSPSPRDS